MWGVYSRALSFSLRSLYKYITIIFLKGGESRWDTDIEVMPIGIAVVGTMDIVDAMATMASAVAAGTMGIMANAAAVAGTEP